MTKKVLTHLFIPVILICLLDSQCWSAFPSAEQTDTSLSAYTNQSDTDTVLVKQARKSRLPQPVLAPIPSKDEVRPSKADEIPPSRELMEIINRVKKQTLDTPGNIRKHPDESEISKSTLQIIKSEGKAVRAGDISPSPALQAVLTAYRNGTLAYTHRSFSPQDEHEQLYYHQPYAEIDLQSIFDMTVLTSGQDIFLSLGLTPLEHTSRTEEEALSQKIRDLQQIVLAFNMKDAKKAAAISAGETKLERIRSSSNKLIKPRKLMLKKLMDFFGIRRKGDINQSYEEMASAFRLYKQWVDRWERMDMYVKKKRKQHIRLNRYRQGGTSDSIFSTNRGTPFSGTKQLQIDKHGYEKIIMPNR